MIRAIGHSHKRCLPDCLPFISNTDPFRRTINKHVLLHRWEEGEERGGKGERREGGEERGGKGERREEERGRGERREFPGRGKE